MKLAATTLLLLGSLYTFGQTNNAQKPAAEVRRYVKAASSPAYAALSDTLRPTIYLIKGEKLTQLDTPQAGWLKFQRGKKEYFVAERFVESLPVLPPPLPTNPQTGRVAFSEVVQVPAVSQAELYTRGKVWFVNHFKSADQVLNAQEKDAGLLVGRAWQPMRVTIMGLPMSTQLWYTVRISFKEGRYKYEITDLAMKSEPTARDLNPSETTIETYQLPNDRPGVLGYKGRQEYLNNAATAADGIAQSIKAALARPATGNDW